MKYKIIPTVFSHNKKEFNQRFNKLIKVSKNLQIDFMDGKFVRAKSILVSQIPNLKGKGNFEAHLMTMEPGKYIKTLKSKGIKKIIFHFNTGDNVQVIADVKKAGMKAFLALNPEDKVSNACYLFQLVDGVLVMGVHPGKEHQHFIVSTLSRVKEIRKINKKIDVQIDGGINPSTIKKLKKAGANIFNTGSFVSDADNPRKALNELKKALK